MQRIVLLIVTLLMNVCSTIAADMDHIRAAFPGAVLSEKNTDRLLEQMLKMKPSPQELHTGYLGALYTLKAKHSVNPVSRLYYLKKGLGLMNEAVAGSPENAELCLLRYSAETKIPGILKSGEHTASDKKVLLNYLQHNVPGKNTMQLIKAISDVLLEQKNLLPSEKQIIVIRKNQCSPL